MSAEAIRWVGIALLAGAVVYLFALWMLKPGEATADPAPPTTSGSNSSVVGYGSTVAAGVRSVAVKVEGGEHHHHYGPPPPAATQPRKSPYAYDPSKIADGLSQAFAVMPERSEREAYERSATVAERVNSTKPDFPLAGLLVRLYALHGPPPQDRQGRERFDRKINLEIMDTVNVEHLTVWGRWEDRPIEKIWQRGLTMATLDHRKGTLSVPSDWQATIYTDIKFTKWQVDQHWPKPTRSVNG